MKRARKLICSRHLWIMGAMFALAVVLHYPQQTLGTESPSLFSFLGLTRHTVERIFLLLPVSYAGFLLGIGAGLASLAVALAIMLPRIFLISPFPGDALLESLGVIIIGVLLNIWFRTHRLIITQRKNAEEMLARIIDGSPVPTFAINRQHKITHWNTAIESLSGIKREEMVGTDGQWKVFYDAKRPVMADLVVDEVSASEIEAHYPGKYKKSRLIEDACEAEGCLSAPGKGGRWLHFTVSPIRDASGEIVGAIEALEDVTEQRNAEENVRYYLREITKAQEEERKRIARELHDDTAQELVALKRRLDRLTSSTKLSVPAISYLEQIKQQTRKILDGVNRFSQDLRPSVLDDLGLVPALEWLTSDLGNHFGIAIGMGLIGPEKRLHPDVELVLFRIAQEALRNVGKHSGASRAWVTLEFQGDKTVLTIRDNGKGFELPANIGDLATTGKLGLVGMEERTHLIGAKLTLQSAVGKGMSVTVEVPS